MSAEGGGETVKETIPVEPVEERDRERANVGRAERAVSAVAGGALVIGGLRRRGLGGAGTALLGAALVTRGVSGNSRLYERLGVDTATERRLRPGVSARAQTIERSVTVGEDADDVAEFLRDTERLSRIVGGFADVSGEPGDYLRWRVEGPLGREIEWQTRIVEDSPGEVIHWESLAGAAVPHEVTARFREAPGDRGTEVHLRIRYDPPGGSLGAAVMDRLGFAPKILAGTALSRLKSLVETGEIPTTGRNPSGRGKGDLI